MFLSGSYYFVQKIDFLPAENNGLVDGDLVMSQEEGLMSAIYVRPWDLGRGAGCSDRGMVLLGMSGKLLFNPSGSLPDAELPRVNSSQFPDICLTILKYTTHCSQLSPPPLSNRSRELISPGETLYL